MLVQCRNLFMGEITRLPLDTELDLSSVEFRGMQPFTRPVHVAGEITVRAGVVRLSVQASLVFEGQCDRCLTPFTRTYTIPMEHVLVATLANEENDDYILLDNYQLNLDDLVLADILLELPYKSLCREDCRGLCCRCGKNLNEGACDCDNRTIDPRLEVLSQLLN